MLAANKVKSLVAAIAIAACVACFPVAQAGQSDNSRPMISGAPPQTANVGATYRFMPAASDADGDALTFSAANLPPWAAFDPTTGTVSGTPTVTGTHKKIKIFVSDGRKRSRLGPFSIAVSPAVNRAPTITGSPTTAARVGQAYSFRPAASDADGDSLNFSVTGMPSWLNLDSGTGSLTGTPTSSAIGSHGPIVMTVSDGKTTASLPAFSIAVAAAPNNPPTISGTPANRVIVGQPYAFQPSASDPDGQALRFGIANRPSWATFDDVTGRLSGTPTEAQAGTYDNIVISVSDGTDSATLPAFSITVANANRAPTISGQPVVAAEVGRPYAFRPTASDADGDALRFSIANRPAWATFEADTGLLYGTPTSAHVGTTSGIVITVTDGTASTSLPAFPITVAAGTSGTATLRWTPPTHNIDGTPIVGLSGYQVSYGTVSRNYSYTLPIAGASTTSVTIEGLAPGTWYFAVKAVATAGVVSDFSNEASKTL